MKRLYAGLAIAAVLVVSPRLLADPYGGTDIGSGRAGAYPGATPETKPSTLASAQSVEVVVSGRELRDLAIRSGGATVDLRLSGKGTVSVGQQPAYARDAIVVEYASPATNAAAIPSCIAIATSAIQTGRSFVIRASSNVVLVAPDHVQITPAASTVACGMR
jgi:hypothetical protein